MSSDGTSNRRFDAVRRLVNQHIDSQPGWPTKFLKLECETHGIYQNEAGVAIDELEEDGTIDQIYHPINGNNRKFIVRTDVDGVEDEPIYERTCEMYEFLTESGYFANLAGYIALCKVHDELEEHIDIDVLPEGSRPFELPHAGERTPDAFMRLPREKIPVEVYNGGDYLSLRSKKYREQITDLTSDEGDDVNSNPLLINRRADNDVRAGIRQMNGMVVDTGCILTTESLYSEFQDAIELFNIDPLIYDLPPLEVADGDSLTGEEYDDLSRDSEAAVKLRPPSEMIADVNELPNDYLQRVRGGVQLLYVNSIYRRSSDPTRKDACYVLQTIYNQLLREGGRRRDDAIKQGWEGAQNRYRRIATLEKRDNTGKDMVLDETGELLTRLQDEHIITKRNDQLHSRKAIHPQPSLSF